MSATAPTPVSQEQTRAAYRSLYDSLNSAYWYASTIQDKDRIHGLAEGVFDIVSQLNAADIRSRTDDFQKLTITIGKVNDRLVKLQADIDGIIHNVSVASDVVDGIAQAVSLAISFLG